MSLLTEFKHAMVSLADKTVTKTDKGKGAYVPDRHQKEVLATAGFSPADDGTKLLLDIHVAGTEVVLKSSYYASVREGSGRTPELRMGRGIINWLKLGDVLWLGTDGQKVFALKEGDVPAATEKTLENIDEETDEDVMLGKLFSDLTLSSLIDTVSKRGKKKSSSFVYERDPAIKTFAKLRAKCLCENPDCNYEGFKKPDGELYVEVHHIVSLAEEGGDIIANVVALCANCHKMAHYSVQKEDLNEKLLKVVKEANEVFLANGLK